MNDDCDTELQHAQQLRHAQQLYDFLRGVIPDDCDIKPDRMPHLTDDQAWTVIWFLGEEDLSISDAIERCNVCGDLYDTGQSGACLDYGEPPHTFCGDCSYGDDYLDKASSDPDGPYRRCNVCEIVLDTRYDGPDEAVAPPDDYVCPECREAVR